MRHVKELLTALVAKTGIVHIKTIEESRIERDIAAVAAKLSLPVYLWTITKGIHELLSDSIDERTVDPGEALSAIYSRLGPGIYVMHDMAITVLCPP